jgi:hypothetical protein
MPNIIIILSAQFLYLFADYGVGDKNKSIVSGAMCCNGLHHHPYLSYYNEGIEEN